MRPSFSSSFCSLAAASGLSSGAAVVSSAAASESGAAAAESAASSIALWTWAARPAAAARARRALLRASLEGVTAAAKSSMG